MTTISLPALAKAVLLPLNRRVTFTALSQVLVPANRQPSPDGCRHNRFQVATDSQRCDAATSAGPPVPKLHKLASENRR